MTRIVEMLPETGYVAPDANQLRSLLKIVCSVHPALRTNDVETQFGRAFWMVGHMFRLPTPSKRHSPSWLLETANQQLLERVGWQPAFFAACLAHGDVCWQKADATLGALYELGLNPWSGLHCANSWRSLLQGRQSACADAAVRKPAAAKRALAGPDISGGPRNRRDAARRRQ